MEQSRGTKMLSEGEGSRQGTAVRAVVLKQSWAAAPGDVQGQGMGQISPLFLCGAQSNDLHRSPPT